LGDDNLYGRATNKQIEKFWRRVMFRAAFALKKVRAVEARSEVRETKTKGANMNNFAKIFLFCLLTRAVAPVAQAQSTTANERPPATGQKAADPETRIPSGSKVFVAKMDGFETYLIAALAKKKTPLLVVTKRDEADFEIVGNSESQKAGWAKIIFGTGLPTVEASIQVINLKTGIVAWAVSEHRRDANFGKRSVAEYLAKKIGEKMRNDEKLSPKRQEIER